MPQTALSAGRGFLRGCFYFCSGGKTMQNNNMVLPLFGGTTSNRLERTPKGLLSQCKRFGEALALAMNLSVIHRKREHTAELLGFDNGGFGRVLNGSRNSLVRPDHAYEVFQNDVILDWFCHLRGKVAVDISEYEKLIKVADALRGLA